MIWRLVSFVAPLGFDTLALALVLGLRGVSPLRPALVFTAFEAAMPLVGIAAGRFVGARFATASEIVGGLILLALAVNACRESFDDDDESAGLEFGTLRTALAAGLAISTDELAVGFPIGSVGLPVAPLIAAIAIQTAIVTVVGIALGRRFGAALGERASRLALRAAGLAFGGVGISLLVEATHH